MNFVPFFAAPIVEEGITNPIVEESVPVFLVLVSVILIAPLLSEIARLPDIIGLIIAGIIIGPAGLNLLAVDETILLFSTVGLIYLMFSAGLEIDLAQFNKVRGRALTFGLFTYSIPQLSGIVLSDFFDLTLAGGVLLGSVYATQTLVAFPIVNRFGIAKNEAVSITIGATIFTDVASLLVLATLAGGHGGGGDPNNPELGALLELIGLIIVYTVVVLTFLPRIGRAFFKRFSGRNVEFQFVLVALFVAAFFAEQIGMEAIVGAFMAGLAINSTLPHHSAVLKRVVFVGEAFFIPIFLMYIGMIADPVAIFTDSETIIIGVVLTLTVYVTKFAAAFSVSRIYNYNTDELMTSFGLSHAHAAVALAVIQIGQGVGLFDEQIFNGAILMVLMTCFTSPLVVQRWGARLRTHATDASTTEQRPLFERILIPVANPDNENNMLGLASILARQVKGQLMPLNIIRTRSGKVDPNALEAQHRILNAESLTDPDTNITPIGRVDSSISRGILNTAIEHQASLIILGWHGNATFESSIFGNMIDEVMWEAEVPALVIRMTTPINAKRRVLLVVPPNSIRAEFVQQTIQTAGTIAKAINVPLQILTEDFYVEDLRAELANSYDTLPHDFSNLKDNSAAFIVSNIEDGDLVIVTTIGSRALFRSSLGNLPEELAERTDASLIVIRYPEEQDSP